MGKVLGYGTQQATAPLAPFNFERRDVQPEDVQIQILFCGICHSDLHTARMNGRTPPTLVSPAMRS